MLVERAEPIYKQIAMHFEREIFEGRMKLGSKLPSTRELATRFKVNPETVQTSLKLLADRGIVERRRKCGTFVRRRSSGKTIGVAVGREIFGSLDMAFFSLIFNRLSGLLEREGWTLRTFVISREPRFDQGFYEMERAISEGALDAIFELCTNDLVVKWLEKDCAIPALINPMRFDYSCFVRMAFDRLLASGRSAPVLICDCEHIGESMLDGIFAGLEGGSISRIHSEPSMSCGYEAAKRLFESGRRFDSLIVLYDNTCRGVLYYLLEKGVELPSAVSLITHSNKGIELFSHIPLTRLEFDPDDFAKDMLLSIEARLAGRVHDAPLIKPVLIEGASCGERKRRRR